MVNAMLVSDGEMIDMIPDAGHMHWRGTAAGMAFLSPDRQPAPEP